MSLTQQQQDKILGALLKNSQNASCADCGAKSPCWASLDFGVFVCLNCSGAHRALGQSVTRIKSTKLDSWNKNWASLMVLGNISVNQYYQFDRASIFNKKPNPSTSLVQIKKFVYDKYVKKLYSKKGQDDPITNIKNGKPAFNEIKNQTHSQGDQKQLKKSNGNTTKSICSNNKIQQQNLIDNDDYFTNFSKNSNNLNDNTKTIKTNSKSNKDIDLFDLQFVSNKSVNTNQNQNNKDFDSLFGHSYSAQKNKSNSNINNNKNFDIFQTVSGISSNSSMNSLNHLNHNVNSNNNNLSSVTSMSNHYDNNNPFSTYSHSSYNSYNPSMHSTNLNGNFNNTYNNTNSIHSSNNIIENSGNNSQNNSMNGNYNNSVYSNNQQLTNNINLNDFGTVKKKNIQTNSMVQLDINQFKNSHKQQRKQVQNLKLNKKPSASWVDDWI